MAIVSTMTILDGETNSIQPGTEVKIDGVFMGVTDDAGKITLDLEPGTHTLEARKHGLRLFDEITVPGMSDDIERPSAKETEIPPPPSRPLIAKRVVKKRQCRLNP